MLEAEVLEGKGMLEGPAAAGGGVGGGEGVVVESRPGNKVAKRNENMAGRAVYVVGHRLQAGAALCKLK